MNRTNRIVVFLLIALCFSSLSALAQSSLMEKKAAISGLTKPDGKVHSVQDAMVAKGLKGLSVAVFENYKVVWTGTWGVKDVASNNRIDTNTAFSTASIAKPITATLFAILEEKGLIDLKTPVSNYLKRWKLPESEFTKKTPVTLEHLLSHTAGTSQHGFRDFYEGDKIPTAIDSLKGNISDNKAISFKFEPGTDWSYSGGGYVIAQIAVEDHLGRPLAELAQEHLFTPLGLKNTTMKQPNEKGFLTNVAKAHDSEGKIIKTGIPITPQVAPSGLWSTPTDMAKFMIEIQNALRGAKTKVVSTKVAQRITKIVTLQLMGGWSLGWERRFGFGNHDWFSHGGANTGVGGRIYATMKNGNGITFFGNGPNQVRGPILIEFALSIIKAHSWRKPLDKTQQKRLTQESIDKAVGTYKHTIFDETSKILFENGRLFLTGFGPRNRELVYLGNETYRVDEYPNDIKIEPSSKDGSVYLVVLRDGIDSSKYDRHLKKTVD